MSITVQLDLSESVAAEAKAKGLLDPQNLKRLIEREVADTNVLVSGLLWAGPSASLLNAAS